MDIPPKSIRGRGAGVNPDGRFEKTRHEPVPPDFPDEDGEHGITTRTFETKSRSALSYNDSPDIGMDVTLNPYRGCEHGCIYCYARPTHEYFGLSAGLDFETKILVKRDAPRLLRRELSRPSWKPQLIVMSGVTDCYQPLEKRLELTRACLKVLADFLNPVLIITKNRLVTRDIDVLRRLAASNAAGVILSVTTLDRKLSSVMEPRASLPEMRLAAIRELTEAGIPAGVNVAPVIPGLTDHEIPAIIQAAAAAGARSAGYTPVRLPYGVSALFEEWLGRHFPDRKEKVLSRIRQIRDGKLNDPNFYSRMDGKGIFAEQMASLFEASCRKYGLKGQSFRLSADSFRRSGQPDLFESPTPNQA